MVENLDVIYPTHKITVSGGVKKAVVGDRDRLPAMQKEKKVSYALYKCFLSQLLQVFQAFVIILAYDKFTERFLKMQKKYVCEACYRAFDSRYALLQHIVDSI